jgi:hypothetical protein
MNKYNNPSFATVFQCVPFLFNETNELNGFILLEVIISSTLKENELKIW